jgi:Zn-dependent M28 family amino/carboxypeptidase
MAAQKGAAAALIIHETGPAGYPWSVVVDSNSRENFDLQLGNSNRSSAAIEGWITLNSAKKICTLAGFDFETLKKLAASRDFRPVPLQAKANFSLRNAIRNVQSYNVAARLEGSGRNLRNEYIIYTAHWDHLGRDDKRDGDTVYHGALDNASGVAGLLHLAKAFSRLPSRPKRSILFLSVTAEEKGLLGSRYYVEHPLYPLKRTLANFNMDGLNPWGKTSDVQIIGKGNSSLEDLLALAAQTQNRVVKSETHPERGYFYRSDHFEFAKAGVPALYFKSGTNYIGMTPEFGLQKIDEYTKNDYHKVTDTVRSDWNLSGATEDLRLLFQVGWTIANGDNWPEWKRDSEFRSRREKMLSTH